MMYGKLIYVALVVAVLVSFAPNAPAQTGSSGQLAVVAKEPGPDTAAGGQSTKAGLEKAVQQMRSSAAALTEAGFAKQAKAVGELAGWAIVGC